MSNLSSFFGAKTATLQKDPMHQVAFGAWSQGFAGGSTVMMLYDHNLTAVDRIMHTSTSNGDTRAQFRDIHSSEFQVGTQANFTTQQMPTGTGGFPYLSGGTGMNFNTFLGHELYPCPERGDAGFMFSKGARQNESTNIVSMLGMSIGLDQNYAFFTRQACNGIGTGATAGFNITGRSMAAGARCYFNNNDAYGSGYANSNTTHPARRVFVEAAGLMTNGYRMSVGGICYNQRTKTLCIFEKSGQGASGRWRPVICKNAPNPADYVDKENDYQVALATACAVSGARIVGPEAYDDNFTGTNQEAARPVLCDNDTVFWYTAPQGQNPATTSVLRWTFNTSNNNWNACTIHAKADSWSVANHSSYTTSGRWPTYQQSLNGETIFYYSCPNNYVTGARIIMINTKTGMTSKLETAQDVTYGWSCSVFGANSMIIQQCFNADGPGMKFVVMDWDSYDHAHGNAGGYSGVDNASLISLVGAYQMDTPYYSTSYPPLINNPNQDNRAITLASNNKFNPSDQ